MKELGDSSKLFGPKKFLLIMAVLALVCCGAGTMMLSASEKPAFAQVVII